MDTSGTYYKECLERTKNIAVFDDSVPEDSKIMNIKSHGNRQTQAKSSYANRRKKLDNNQGKFSLFFMKNVMFRENKEI